MKKLALFGARPNNRGLGIQTWEFYKNLNPDLTFIILLDGDSKDYVPRFPNGKLCLGVPTDWIIDKWLDENKPEVVFCAETPYNYYLFEACRKRGIKTILQYNFEFLDYLNHPEYPFPDILLATSKWHIKDVESAFGHMCRVEYLPFPVNRDVLPFKQKKRAKRFVHIAGEVELYQDRNGTQTVIDSLQYIVSKIQLTIYVGNDETKDKMIPKRFENGPRVDLEMVVGTIDNYWDLYKDQDVFLSPRRYAGMSLPLNESLSTGMIPIMPNIGPQNHFLHPMSLTPVCGRKWVQMRSMIDVYEVDPQSLAKHIDIIAGLNKDQVAELSMYSNLLADLVSWKNLKSKYLKLFKEVYAPDSQQKKV